MNAHHRRIKTAELTAVAASTTTTAFFECPAQADGVQSYLVWDFDAPLHHSPIRRAVRRGRSALGVAGLLVLCFETLWYILSPLLAAHLRLDKARALR